MASAENILSTYLHVADGGRTETVPVGESFWSDMASGQFPQLDRGRLMSAFTFSEPWSSWERHPAGEELVMLLSGSATLILEQASEERSVTLHAPGDFVLIPANTWHTAKTTVETTMVSLTPGAGTEHRPVGA